MKDFIRNINETLRKQGRYGADMFSLALLISAAVFLVFGFITGAKFFFLYALLGAVWPCIRIFSKNISKREAELEAYEDVAERNRENAALRKRKWADRKTHRYFRCKYCDTVFRVPKGKGKVIVTCPVCKEQFTKKT